VLPIRIDAQQKLLFEVMIPHFNHRWSVSNHKPY